MSSGASMSMGPSAMPTPPIARLVVSMPPGMPFPGGMLMFVAAYTPIAVSAMPIASTVRRAVRWLCGTATIVVGPSK